MMFDKFPLHYLRMFGKLLDHEINKYWIKNAKWNHAKARLHDEGCHHQALDSGWVAYDWVLFCRTGTKFVSGDAAQR